MEHQKLYMMAGLAALLGTLGCQSFKAKTLEPVTSIVKKNEEYPVTTPVKVVGLWKEATLDNVNGKAIRGFAGRVYFFNQEDQPVKVEGELVVYGFDDSHESGQRETPDKKFVIAREGLANKYSVSDVGPSYSVWLPWDEVGGFQKNIALVTMFKGADGAVVRSEATKNALPGKQQPHITERESLLKEFHKSIRSMDQSTDAGVKTVQEVPSSGISTTTIQLSPNMQEKLESSENHANLNPAFPGVVIPAGIVPLAAFPGTVENSVIPAYNATDAAQPFARPISTIGEPEKQISTSANKRTSTLPR